MHVHKGALRLAYNLRGPEGLALVTDAMEAETKISSTARPIQTSGTGVLTPATPS